MISPNLTFSPPKKANDSSSRQPITHPIPEPLPMLTPTTLSLVLAYLQYYTPKSLPRGRFISPSHLRNLACWIGKPSPQMRSLRQHQPLAAHINLLYTVGFLAHDSSQLIPQPTTSSWLHLSHLQSLQTLLTALTSPLWGDTLEKLNLTQIITEDISAYLQQSLTRQIETATTPIPYEPIQWLPPAPPPDATPDQWTINLPGQLPPWLHFDLRQLGTWSPREPLRCTPYTIATATLRGYSLDIIRWLLETAAQAPLPLDKQTQLKQWCQRAQTYQIRTVRLLSTTQPAQLTSLMRHKQLRQAAISQISPHHLLVKEDMITKLAPWLQAQGYPLQHDLTSAPDSQSASFTEYQWQWLSAKVLKDIGQLIPLPCPSPHALLETASQYLTPLEITNLAAIATKIQEGLRQAIVGRDAFFPASQPVTTNILHPINRAIEQETSLTITYQALGEHQPSTRQIQPLRLEQRGHLYYLTAHCYRAETNLTFRLDRIKEIIT
ncbi:MAG: WYL domain-containing protein [Ardenticatenaceae bacterium]|nr:WYL domain-containing protein [Ardenticatenaceae bacterium]